MTTYNKTKAGYSKGSLGVSKHMSSEKPEIIAEEESNDQSDLMERTPEIIDLNEVSGNNDD